MKLAVRKLKELEGDEYKGKLEKVEERLKKVSKKLRKDDKGRKNMFEGMFDNLGLYVNLGVIA